MKGSTGVEPGLYRSRCTWRMRADSASDTARWAWRAQKRVEPVVPRAMLYYPSDTQSSHLFHWNMIYYPRLQDTHLNRHSFKQPQCEYGELTGNRWYGLLSNAIRCRVWRMKIAHFAKVVFCLDQINFTILDQAFNKMPRYLLIFDKAPPPS